jgi:D-alanyl-D-alanine carboxypeptidase
VKPSWMKRTLAVLLACIALQVGTIVHAQQTPVQQKPVQQKAAEQKPVQPKPVVEPFVVIDAKTGEVLAQNRAGETWYPASLTKLFTAYVVFQRLREGKLKLDQQIAVTARAAHEVPSKIGVPAGKTVSVDFALQAMLVYSANDMALVLAEAAGGTVENFATDLNRLARSIGLSSSHFVNPNGLYDPRQVSSARDIAIIAALIYNQFPEHARYFSQAYVAVGKRKLANRNSLIRMMPDADGMKTGFVCNSGYNLVASASRNGRKLIAVILGAKNGGARAAIARNLLEQGFLKQPSPQGQKVAEIVDLPQGAIVPADMTKTVCRTKNPVQLATAEGLSGWAISFGSYDDVMKADMALRGRLLSPVGIATRSSAGVVKLPEKAGFAALMWNIPQEESVKLCNDYRAEGAHCDLMPPALVEQIANVLRASAPPPKPVAQGSDGNEPRNKPAKKRVKKKQKSK